MELPDKSIVAELDPADTDPFHLDDVQAQRQLTDEGRRKTLTRRFAGAGTCKPIRRGSSDLVNWIHKSCFARW